LIAVSAKEFCQELFYLRVTEVFVDGALPSLVATCRSSIPALQLSTMVSPTLYLKQENKSLAHLKVQLPHDLFRN
jgi:hypothetical protein